jgi:hypothetical protein
VCRSPPLPASRYCASCAGDVTKREEDGRGHHRRELQRESRHWVHRGQHQRGEERRSPIAILVARGYGDARRRRRRVPQPGHQRVALGNCTSNLEAIRASTIVPRRSGRRSMANLRRKALRCPKGWSLSRGGRRRRARRVAKVAVLELVLVQRWVVGVEVSPSQVKKAHR